MCIIYRVRKTSEDTLRIFRKIVNETLNGLNLQFCETKQVNTVLI